MKDNYKIRVPKNGAFTIKTEPDFINLHGVILAVAKRGVGKTVAFSNLLRLMRENHVLDRLVLVSPTYHNNKDKFYGLGLDEENDILEPDKYTPELLMELLDEEGLLYDEYHEKMKKWKLLQQKLKSNIPIEKIDPFLLLELNNITEKPYHRYNGKKPVIVIFFDDCQGSDLFKPTSKLSNMVIKHRHLGKTKDGALGCSLLFACQNYTSNSMGLPKSIRGNLTHMLVFKNKNQKELDLIAEECSGEINTEQFFELYDKAIQEPHDFLFIDFAKKREHPSMFRRNFNEWLIP
jgi:hypothetical protein